VAVGIDNIFQQYLLLALPKQISGSEFFENSVRPFKVLGSIFSGKTASDGLAKTAIPS
jgi:hypothetical protein